MKNDESFIKQRLSLINLILEGFNPDEQYKELKKKNENINQDIEKLKFIKDNIIKYYGDFYQDIIKRIIDVIKDNQNKKIIDFKGGKIKELIKESDNLKETAEKINKVKDLLLFNVIYEMNSGKNEDKNFNNAFEKLENIGQLIKDNKNNDINELYNYLKFDLISLLMLFYHNLYLPL